MSKEQQDKIWNYLSEEKKKIYIEDYSILGNEHSTNEFRKGEIRGLMRSMEIIFGSHNLNPKPPTPKTWEDVAALREYNIDAELNKIKNAWIGYPICNKMIATAKIAKLIELGYGGQITAEEWNDERVKKYCVVKVKNKIESDGFYVETYKFIAFHTPEQRDEFMSHESNRKLVEQYYMM